jgi:hypothetical protein
VIYIIAYIAFGVPVVIAGQLGGPLGLVPTVFWYSTVTVRSRISAPTTRIR